MYPSAPYGTNASTVPPSGSYPVTGGVAYPGSYNNNSGTGSIQAMGFTVPPPAYSSAPPAYGSVPPVPQQATYFTGGPPIQTTGSVYLPHQPQAAFQVHQSHHHQPPQCAYPSYQPPSYQQPCQPGQGVYPSHPPPPYPNNQPTGAYPNQYPHGY